MATYNSDRFDKIYQNISRLRCGLRVKYEELRIIWGRQELKRYKSRYANQGAGNSTACAQDIENELHLYVECTITREFMDKARQ